ncbi:hypothetical protein FRB91_006700 [Serendipita sp. 411]|nr:hypothetical protein FRB91_006700 [Serendipita sp. 411]
MEIHHITVQPALPEAIFYASSFLRELNRTNPIAVAKPNPTREGGCSSRQCIIGDDGFSIDNLVGRKPDPANAGNYLWLIKWYGFGVEDSTWKPTVTFDSAALIVEWYEAAQKEGHSQKYLASQESESDVILIGDAKGKGPWPESDD